MNAIMLLLSDVFKDVARVKVVALAFSGGEPESSKVCSRPEESMSKGSRKT